MSSGKCGARETSYYVDAQLPNHFFECSLVISQLPPHTSAGKRYHSLPPNEKADRRNDPVQLRFTPLFVTTGQAG